MGNGSWGRERDANSRSFVGLLPVSEKKPKPPKVTTPKGLRPEEIGTLLDELSALVVGARLEKVFDRPPHGFLFRFRGSSGRQNVFFTTRPGTSRFHLVEDVGESPKTPSGSATELRTWLGGMRVVSIDQPGGGSRRADPLHPRS